MVPPTGAHQLLAELLQAAHEEAMISCLGHGQTRPCIRSIGPPLDLLPRAALEARYRVACGILARAIALVLQRGPLARLARQRQVLGPSAGL